MSKKIYLIYFIILVVSFLFICFKTEKIYFLNGPIAILIYTVLLLFMSFLISRLRSIIIIEKGIKRINKGQIFNIDFLSIYKSKNYENYVIIENAQYWLDSKLLSIKKVDETFKALNMEVNKLIRKHRLLKQYINDKTLEIVLKDLKNNTIEKKEILKKTVPNTAYKP